MTDTEKFDAAFIAWVNSPERGLTLINSDVQLQIEWKAWQAALASQQPAGGGWIDWAGGDQPVDDNAVVEVRFRSGAVESGELAECYEWNHGYHDLSTTSVDIIAYRVVKP